MTTIPNQTARTLLRALPLILDSIDGGALAANTRLANAVRLARQIVKRLNKMEYEQRND